MTRKLASLITWMCTLWLIVFPLAAAYLLVDLQTFAALATRNLALPIQWETVVAGQWLTLWAATLAWLALGYAGTWHLRQAFKTFAGGQWFEFASSRQLRRCAALLLLQGVAQPLHFAVASVVLSLHHPPGEKLLSLSLGSDELRIIATGLILWVLADLLVEGTKADAENRQFV